MNNILINKNFLTKKRTRRDVERLIKYLKEINGKLRNPRKCDSLYDILKIERIVRFANTGIALAKKLKYPTTIAFSVNNIPLYFKDENFDLLQFQLNYILGRITVLELLRLVDLQIPRFCFHKNLSIAGNCRMCLIEVSNSDKPVASCAFTLVEGVHIYTDSSLVKQARENVLEFLLVNHPLDCPICDQGGECDLQDISFVYGSDRGRYNEIKRSADDMYIHPYVKTIMTRCIHCTRCIRYFDEILGLPSLGTMGRGFSTEVSAYISTEIHSNMIGNVIDLCPVGALTNKPSAFVFRSWELESVYSNDVISDCISSSIRIDIRGNTLMRVLPSRDDKVNQVWITDKIRFYILNFMEYIISSPLLRIPNVSKKLRSVSWSDGLSFLNNLFKNLNKSKKKYDLFFFTNKYFTLNTFYHFYNLFKILGASSFNTNVYKEIDNRTSYLISKSIRGYLDGTFRDKMERDRMEFEILFYPSISGVAFGGLTNSRLNYFDPYKIDGLGLLSLNNLGLLIWDLADAHRLKEVDHLLFLINFNVDTESPILSVRLKSFYTATFDDIFRSRDLTVYFGLYDYYNYKLNHFTLCPRRGFFSVYSCKRFYCLEFNCSRYIETFFGNNSTLFFDQVFNISESVNNIFNFHNIRFSFLNTNHISLTNAYEHGLDVEPLDKKSINMITSVSKVSDTSFMSNINEDAIRVIYLFNYDLNDFALSDLRKNDILICHCNKIDEIGLKFYPYVNLVLPSESFIEAENGAHISVLGLIRLSRAITITPYPRWQDEFILLSILMSLKESFFVENLDVFEFVEERIENIRELLFMYGMNITVPIIDDWNDIYKTNVGIPENRYEMVKMQFISAFEAKEIGKPKLWFFGRHDFVTLGFLDIPIIHSEVCESKDDAFDYLLEVYDLKKSFGFYKINSMPIIKQYYKKYSGEGLSSHEIDCMMVGVFANHRVETTGTPFIAHLEYDYLFHEILKRWYIPGYSTDNKCLNELRNEWLTI